MIHGHLSILLHFYATATTGRSTLLDFRGCFKASFRPLISTDKNLDLAAEKSPPPAETTAEDESQTSFGLVSEH